MTEFAFLLFVHNNKHGAKGWEKLDKNLDWRAKARERQRDRQRKHENRNPKLRLMSVVCVTGASV
jgi:hypothetical protein